MFSSFARKQVDDSLPLILFGSLRNAAPRMAEFFQCHLLKLANSFSGDAEYFSGFLQRVFSFFANSKAHADDLFLARAESRQDSLGLALKVQRNGRCLRVWSVMVRDQISERSFSVLAHGRIQRNRFLYQLAHRPDRFQGQRRFGSYFLQGRLVAEIPDEAMFRRSEFPCHLNHVNRDADGPRLVGQSPSHRLAYPPARIGRKPKAQPVVEFLHRPHQTDVSLLDEIEKLKAPAAICLWHDYDPE